ncbi:MAG TPA: hypothetical protein VIM58_12930 [Candidatus Methylacidiphilales bacterium]
MRLLRTLPGLVLFGLFLNLGFLYNGGHLESILHPGEWFILLFAPFGALSAAYGIGATFRLTFASFSGKRRDGDLSLARLERFLGHWIVAIYAISVISFCFATVITMGFMSGEAAVIGEKIASALVSFIVAVGLVEGIVRPLQRRVREEIAQS